MKLRSGAATALPTTTTTTTLPFTAAVGFMLTTLYFVLSQLSPDTGHSEFYYDTRTPAFYLFSPIRGFTLEQLLNHGLRVLLLGPGLVCLSLGFARMLQLRAAELPRLDRACWYACFASLLTTAYVMLFVLHGQALVDDEITYSAMARSFAHGHLAEPVHAGQLLDRFEVLTRAGITGKYLFGEPLLQMLGCVVGLPALLHIPINALTLYALYRAVQLLFDDRKLAALSCGLLAISPTFMLCGATAQAQPSALACVMVSVLGYALAKQTQHVLAGGLLAGTALGFGLAVRMQALAPAGAVLGCAFVLLAVRERRLRGLLGFAFSSLLGVAAIASYNFALSGDALTLPWFLQGASREHYGFVQVWSSVDFVHTPLGALQNLAVVGLRMNSWLLGWPLILLMIWRRSALQRVLARGAIVVWIAVALSVFELGYYSSGASDVGPNYHFEIVPSLCVIGAQCLLELWQHRPELALMGAVIHTLLGTGSFVWEQTARLARLHEAIYERPLALFASVPARALLLFPPANPCQPRYGWVARPFPLVEHDPRAAVVSYLVAGPQSSAQLSAQFLERRCFYLQQHEVVPCAAAHAEPQQSCTREHSSAEKLSLWLATKK